MLAYRKEIDGLRAIAVLPVILFHAGFNVFSGGFVGVDVFFVISGFLITSIILNEKEDGTFSLLNFYERRVRRILPALFFVIFVSMPIAALCMMPFEMKEMSQSLMAIPFFVSNVVFWMQSGYFAESSDFKPFIHTWTLAVEEQYYFIFPLLVMALWRFGTKRILIVLGGIAVVSFLFASVLQKGTETAFFLIHARAWELLVGAIGAFVNHFHFRKHNPVPIHIRSFLSGAGIVLILISVFVFDEETPFPSAYTMVPVVGTALFLLFSGGIKWVAQVIGNRVFVGVGLISYSAYLWHQPIFAFARLLDTGKLASFAYYPLIALTFLCAFISYLFVEKPFRDRKKLSRKTVFAASLLASAVCVFIGLYGYFSNGFEKIYVRNLSEDRQKIYAYLKKNEFGDQYDEMPKDKECVFWQRSLDDAFAQRFEACAKNHGKGVLVIGDSHSMNIYGALARNNAYPFLASITRGNCRIHGNKSLCDYRDIEGFLARHKKQIRMLVYHQTARFLFKSDHADYFSSDLLKMQNIPMLDFNEENISATISYLDSVSSGIDIVWLGPRIEPMIRKNQLWRSMNASFKIRDDVVRNYSALDDYLKEKIMNGKHAFRYVSLQDAIAFGKETDLFMGDCVTFRDSDHFSVCGERIFGPRIKNSLVK